MLVIIVGKTSSGKDGVAEYLKEKYGIPDLVSYSTRPKRGYEVNGKEHWFITNEEIQRIKDTEDLVAWTINDQTKIEYCATVQAMPAETSTYILNPHGLHWGITEGKLKTIPYVTIYVECSEEKIISRGEARGDNPETLRTRLASERDEFDTFRDNKEWDYIVSNNGTKEELLSQVDEVCKNIGLKAIE